MPDAILYRRHAPECKHAKKGRNYTACKCPIWRDGYEKGVRVRRSMETRNWDRAQRALLPAGESTSATLADASESYQLDCAARELASSTLRSYRNTLRDFLDYAKLRGLVHTSDLRVEHFSAFRQSRKGRKGKMRPASLRKELETLRGWCEFCISNGWIKDNPAKKVKPPRESFVPTMPFEKRDIVKVLAACDLLGEDNPNEASAKRARVRARALILILLYAGLRISDAAILERSRLDESTGKILIRVMKTGTPLYISIPRPVIEALQDLPEESKRYFLWSGNGKVTAHIGSLRRTVSRLMKLAGIKNGNPHRFRDTFAVRLLESGVPIRTVQLLLGHSSVQTTEKHYAPYVASHQKMLDSAVSNLDFLSSAVLPEVGEQEFLGDSEDDPIARFATTRKVR